MRRGLSKTHTLCVRGTARYWQPRNTGRWKVALRAGGAASGVPPVAGLARAARGGRRASGGRRRRGDQGATRTGSRRSAVTRSRAGSAPIPSSAAAAFEIRASPAGTDPRKRATSTVAPVARLTSRARSARRRSGTVAQRPWVPLGRSRRPSRSLW
ncbi:hypothetical protein FJM51_02540 [Amaricoccus solimangrovi]|uniref:Uncharacterized protein n=1 Tax=Amaricoccus solimangrovi TaxID=2589815 RepID=A0A501X101_9RHOB|nr:hypothetical protein FJM51_02540 [Amaricoccus solimangrovi]